MSRDGTQTEQLPGVVLSGATGFLGGEVLARLLMRERRPIYVLIRAGDEAEARARLEATLIELMGSAAPWTDRTHAVAADLTRRGSGSTGTGRAGSPGARSG